MKINNFTRLPFLFLAMLCISHNLYGQQTCDNENITPLLQWATNPLAFISYTITIIAITFIVSTYYYHKQSTRKAKYQDKQLKPNETHHDGKSQTVTDSTLAPKDTLFEKDKTECNKEMPFIRPTESAASAEETLAIVQRNDTPAEPEHTQTKYKLLIIEDHKDISMYLKILFSEDYIVHLAENGKKGIEIAHEISPDLVISDVMMPIMDGFELARTLKEDIKTCHIPIILLTALTSDEAVMKGMDLGADDYVMKPFNADVLKSKAKRLIKNRIELKKAYTKLLIPANISNENNDNTEDNSENPLIAKIIRLVGENIQNEDFSVKKLAEMVNMSQPTLYRKVKQSTNFTIIEIIRGVRLKKAAELLRTKNYNIHEVAEAVGYNDVPTFRKHFVEVYGVTPSAFCKEEA